MHQTKLRLLFWDDIYKELLKDLDSEVLMMGDFNVVLDS